MLHGIALHNTQRYLPLTTGVSSVENILFNNHSSHILFINTYFRDKWGFCKASPLEEMVHFFLWLMLSLNMTPRTTVSIFAASLRMKETCRLTNQEKGREKGTELRSTTEQCLLAALPILRWSCKFIHGLKQNS